MSLIETRPIKLCLYFPLVKQMVQWDSAELPSLNFMQ